MTAGASVIALTDAFSGPLGQRGLRVGLLNLMPDKARTVAQIARLLDGKGGEGPLHLVPCVPDSYRPRSGDLPRDHRRWTEVVTQELDGLIISGAPFDRMAYEEVSYWSELCEIFDWCEKNLSSTLFLCWSAMAALQHYCGVERWRVDPKLSGLYRQEVVGLAPLSHGLGASYCAPVSRYALIDPQELAGEQGLQVLARSQATGVSLAQRDLGRQVFLLDHLEYGPLALQDEYLRDRAIDPRTPLPCNYFPDDDAHRPPRFDWQPTARRFFANWVALLRAAPEHHLVGWGATQ